jgi:DNA sulfur modification protein DndB
MEPTEQLSIFMDINENQKAVSATLRITLEEDLYWNSERADSRMKALRSSIIRELSGAISSPLYNKISIGEDKAELSANPFAKALSKSGLLPIAKGNQFTGDAGKHSLYDASNLNHDKEMSRAKKSIVAFINLCYQYVEENFREIFNKDRYFIVSNRGTFAFISLIASLNTYESELGNVDVKTSAQDRFGAISKYLEALLKELKSIDKEMEENMLSMLGSGPEVVWFRFFQEQVNKIFSSYEPADLMDWKERQDLELQDTGRKLGTEIEKYIKRKVIGNLKSLFDSNWDIEIGSIKRSCEDRASKDEEKYYKDGLGRKDIKWTEMFFISDYKTIMEKYWAAKPKDNVEGFQSFSELFSLDVGHGFNSKSEKLKWLSLFNSHRNNWAHEGTKEKGLNREEVDFLKNVHDSLVKA